MVLYNRSQYHLGRLSSLLQPSLGWRLSRAGPALVPLWLVVPILGLVDGVLKLLLFATQSASSQTIWSVSTLNNVDMDASGSHGAPVINCTPIDAKVLRHLRTH